MHLPVKFASLQETYEQRRKDYMGELQKREDEMRGSFIKKVKNKEAELKQEEQEVQFDFAVAVVAMECRSVNYSTNLYHINCSHQLPIHLRPLSATSCVFDHFQPLPVSL